MAVDPDDRPIRFHGSPYTCGWTEGSTPMPDTFGYYGTCFRCHVPQVALFRRPFAGDATWDLCRGCIADLELEQPAGAFDQDEEAEGETGPEAATGSTQDSLLEAVAVAVLVGVGVLATTWALWQAAEFFLGW